MPWRAALLKGNRVLARCDEAGAFVDEGGRVEVRYRPTDARAYRAGVRNLTALPGPIHPDDHCVPAQAEPAPSAAASPASASSASSASASRATNNRVSGTKKAAVAKALSPGEAQRVLDAAEVVAFTDGACSGNPGPCGIGVVLLSEKGKSQRELSEYLGTGTNNVAELTAILRALEAAPNLEQTLNIHTDSQYAIGVLQKGWKAKANQELIAAIKERMRRFKALKLIYVPGHSGVPLNERADELARMAVSSRSTSAWREVKVLRATSEV